MLSTVAFWFIIALSSTYGHNNKFVQTYSDDANLQSDLMPQELNPEFKSLFDPKRQREVYFPEIPNMPVRPLLPPKLRIRRDTSEASDNAVTETSYVTSVAEQVKQYSRIVACFVLVVSAAIEIVVYIIEAYQTEGA